MPFTDLLTVCVSINRRLTSGRPRSQSSPVGYKKPEEGRAEGEGEGKKQPAGSVVDLSTRPSVTATPGAGQAGGRGRGESREKRRVQTVEDSPSRPCTSSRESSRKVCVCVCVCVCVWVWVWVCGCLCIHVHVRVCVYA